MKGTTREGQKQNVALVRHEWIPFEATEQSGACSTFFVAVFTPPLTVRHATRMSFFAECTSHTRCDVW